MDNSKRLKIDVDDLLKYISSTHPQSFSVEADAHKTEAEELKKAWYNYVLVTIEKLDKRVKDLYDNQLDSKTQVFKEAVVIKDDLRKEISVLLKELREEIYKQEQKLNRYVKETIEIKLEASSSDLKQLLAEEISNVSSDYKNDISKYKEENIKTIYPMKTILTEVKVKVGLWGGLAGFITSLLVLILSYLLRMPKPPTP